MKKIFTTICVLTGVYLGASAQTKNSFELGFNAGVNIATAGKDANERTALNGGIIGEYYLNNTWSLKAKVSYDQKGRDDGQVTFGAVQTAPIDNIHTDYITVPILAAFHFGPDHGWYFNFGPYVGFLASAKGTANGADLKQYYHSTDGGLDAGIGYKFKLAGKVKMFLEYDGQFGVSNIYSGNIGRQENNDRSAFNIGLMFALR